MPHYIAAMLEADPRRKRRLIALPAPALAGAGRTVARFSLDLPDGPRTTVDVAGEPVDRAVAGCDWTVRFLRGDDVVGFAQVTEFVAPGPTLDSALFLAMDAHSPDACALFLLLRRHFEPELPALGSLAHLATIQILPGRFSRAGWIEGFERALSQIPWRRTPAILAGLPYPLEYACGADMSHTPVFRRRADALVRFYERRLGFTRLADQEDTWIWRAQNLSAWSAAKAGLLLRQATPGPIPVTNET